MKKIIILLSTIFLFFKASAQFSFGPKAGVNIAKEKEANTVYSTSSHTFFLAGLFANYKFAKQFAAQLELVYSGEGTEEHFSGNGIKNDGVVTINRINIPLLFQYKSPVGLYLETGPQVGLLLSAKGKYTANGNFDFKANTKSTFFSWCLGAGYQIKALQELGIGVRYATGLSNSNQGSVNAKSIKSNVLSVALFYPLHASNKTK